MSAETERARLSQQGNLDDLLRPIGPTEMVTVCHSSRNDDEHWGIYCALIPSGKIEQALSRPEWDLRRGSGMPSSIGGYGEGAHNAEYLRFGNEDGIEPLVIDRDFHGFKESYLEISEEFRLFHNLHQDRNQGRYIKFDDNGNEIVVATIIHNHVKIRLLEIKQFLAIKEMHLSIQFDIIVCSDRGLAELGIAPSGPNVQQDGLSCWSLNYNHGEHLGAHIRSFSRLLGIRLVEPLPKSKSGFEGFAEESAKQYSDFIIGVHDNGDDIIHTCNPDLLSNYFGSNPGAPNFVVPVSFRKQVLDKYYQEPSKYTIADGVIWCGSLWYLDIDNHHDDKICAQLGDLGHLPYQEQLYWRAYNIVSDSGYSDVTLRRDFLSEWVDSARPEHVFQERYKNLSEVCQENLGWQIFLPLESGDEYLIRGIRVPATAEQRDFDDLVLGLAKILTDSINVKELCALLSESNGASLSIQLLESALERYNTEDTSVHIDFLRNLQQLRSSGSAHRKGGGYTKAFAKFSAGGQDLRTVFTKILWQAVALLECLIEVVKSRQIPATG